MNNSDKSDAIVLQGIVLVYDVTNKESFQMIDYWMKSIDNVRCTLNESK